MLLQQVADRPAIGSLEPRARACADVVTDSSQGALRNTGNDLDLAIAGDGFFAVQAPAGVRYTRDGAFSVDAAGPARHRARRAGARHERPPDHDPAPATTGHDRRAGQRHRRTGARSPRCSHRCSTRQTLRKQGDDLYQGTAQAGGAPGRVEQGYLEQSNVNSVREMVDLIATMRSFEASQKVIQALDETLGKAINEVGRL